MRTTSSSSESKAGGRPDRGTAGALVGELFAAHGRMVLGLCRLLLRDPVEAEDAAQQVFVSAHRSILRGSPPRDAAAWLAAIARNECRGRVRARRREPLALSEVPSDLPDPLAGAVRALDLEAIWAALSALPRRQRRALVLREVGGLSYGELGRALGVSQSAVQSLLFRARRQVRTVLTGANTAAVPLALRDQLERLIPGFDPPTAGVLARVAALPIGLKLASAAAGVGALATGVAEMPRHSSDRFEAKAPISRRTVVPASAEQTSRSARSAPVLVSARVLPTPHRTLQRHEEARRHERERRTAAQPKEAESGHGAGTRERHAQRHSQRHAERRGEQDGKAGKRDQAGNGD